MSGYAELVRKLGIKPSSRIVAVNPNPEIISGIKTALPKEATIQTAVSTNTKADIILIWLTDKDDLARTFWSLEKSIVPDGAIWAVIPKKLKGKTTGVSFDEVQAAALKLDLVDNKIASFSDKEYGTRFVIRKEKRGTSTSFSHNRYD